MAKGPAAGGGESSARRSRGSDPPEVLGTGFLLSALGAHSAMNFAQRLAPLDLTPPHVGLLRGIGMSPGRSQQAIAEEFGMPPSRLVAFIDDLEYAGLVERRRDERDRRAHCLFLTSAGDDVMIRIAEIGRESEEALLGSLTAEERGELHALLQRLMAAQHLSPGVHPGFKMMKAAEDPPAQ